MPFAVDKFAHNLYKSGVAPVSAFEVIINPPRSIFGSSDSIEYNSELADKFFTGIDGTKEIDNIKFRVEQCEIPGRSAATIEHSHYGPMQKVGYRAIYPDVTMTIICSTDLREKMFFDRWLDLTVGMHRIDGLDADTRKTQFDVGYFDEYIAPNIEIRQYQPTGKDGINTYWYHEPMTPPESPIYKCNLVKAYPTIVAPLQGDWNQEGIHKLQVTFSFQYYTSENTPTNNPATVNKGLWINTSGAGAGLATALSAGAGQLLKKV